MRAALLYSAAGSLLLSALTAAPDAAPGAAADRSGAAEMRGTAVAAARAKAAGVDFGPCPDAQDLPGSMRCGTVTVPLDYARPDGRQIELLIASSSPAPSPVRLSP
ncbi:alpha/beta hydrolase, partial [Streptomyces sp. NPDC006386]